MEQEVSSLIKHWNGENNGLKKLHSVMGKASWDF